ncbi:alpha/beta hydrolase (plasmid) [Rhizobium sp. T1470]|uniref:alpha/beta hydrolase n=2 Tax=Rhizobium TaxID=379 RepID=UPI001CD2B74C|nr:alpha/beta hydrolase [Rhizobium sp. T1473]MCA0804864.1 alpha/beta hydrolase [Rhizobium sp. T1473]
MAGSVDLDRYLGLGGFVVLGAGALRQMAVLRGFAWLNGGLMTRWTIAWLAAGIALAPLALPARAGDTTPQTQASKEQVRKLIATWEQHYAKADSLRDRRDAFEALMASTPEPTRVQIRQVDAGGVDAQLIWPARLHHPLGRRAILYIHGGGFYSGSLRTHRAVAGSLAKAASADVLLIDYRLAPDYPYPAQVDDALTAYRWLLDSGYESNNIVVAGNSVGGNLAIEATLRQMRVKGSLPAAVVAVSPITDLAATGASLTTNASTAPLIDSAELDLMRKAYLGTRSPADPMVSPLYADLTGFPPLLMQVGAGEALLDDTLRLADKARRAGVDVQTEIWAGMVHQWQLFPFWLDDARQSNQHVAEYAIKHFADKPQQ